MREYTAKIVENIPIAENIHSLTFELPEKPEVRAGQFAELSVGGSHLLAPPFGGVSCGGKENYRLFPD